METGIAALQNALLHPYDFSKRNPIVFDKQKAKIAKKTADKRRSNHVKLFGQ